MKLKLTRKPLASAAKPRKIKIRLTRLSEKLRKTQLLSEDTPAKPRLDLTLNPTTALTGRPAAELAVAETPEQKRLWKARSFAGRHLPVLQCNNCSLSRVCQKYRAGYECAFLPFLHSHRIETVQDLTRYMKDFVGNSMRRAQLMNIIETANGGMPSVETSEALDMAFNQLKSLHQVMTEGGETIELEGDANSVIGAIFGGMQAKKLIEETAQMRKADPIVDLPPVPQTENPTALPQDPNIAQELLRDAILNQRDGASNKKDLQKSQEASIEVSEVRIHNP